MLTAAMIQDMTDEQILALTVPHPEIPGQRAFILSLKSFEGDRAAMAEAMAALTIRLREISPEKK